ncbi:hypothetical protein [Flagellimonas sp. 2504JD4-2]
MSKIRTNHKMAWLIKACIISSLLISTYLISHINNHGGEEVFLNGDQLAAINTMITLEYPSSIENLSQKELDSIENNTKNLIYNYLENVLPGDNSTEIGQLFKDYNTKHLSAILPKYSFRVESFFWLVGNKLFLEIIFWALFGLMANLMYTVPITEKFDKKRIPEHIGKIFYTPFVVIVIYLSINGIVNKGTIQFDGVGKSVIVLAFVLGFFTRRSVVLIGRIKDLILPVRNGNQDRPIKPDEQGNSIRGNVVIDNVDETVREMNNEYVAVTITGIESDYMDSVNPDKTGMFFFNDIPDGNYKIESELVIGDKRYYDEGHIEIIENTEPIDISVVLKESEVVIK